MSTSTSCSRRALYLQGPCLLKFLFTLGRYLVKSDCLYEAGISGIEYFVRVQINLPDLPTLPEVLLFSDKLSERVRSAAAAGRKKVRYYM